MAKSIRPTPVDAALLQAPDVKVRRKAAHNLSQAPTIAAQKALAKALNDSDQWVRVLAAIALGKLGDPACIASLIKVVQYDSDGAIRILAARALGEIGDRTAVPALIAALKEEGAVAPYAAIALGDIGDPAAIPHLVEVMTDERFHFTPRQALVKIGGPQVTAQMVSDLENEDSARRLAAANVLSMIADPASVHALIRALEDTSSYVRANAESALEGIGTPEAQAALDAWRTRSDQ